MGKRQNQSSSKISTLLILQDKKTDDMQIRKQMNLLMLFQGARKSWAISVYANWLEPIIVIEFEDQDLFHIEDGIRITEQPRSALFMRKNQILEAR